MMNKEELIIRVAMCKLCVKTLDEDCKDDPRQPDALDHYKKQLASLEDKLDQASEITYANVVPKPPDIVIGLKPATLSGKVPRLGE